MMAGFGAYVFALCLPAPSPRADNDLKDESNHPMVDEKAENLRFKGAACE
jgi:hypothetical protein